MALDGSRLGKNIANLIIDSKAPASEKARVEKLWIDICSEIVSEITTNGEVASGIPVSTAGSPTAQTGATTGTGKIQ